MAFLIKICAFFKARRKFWLLPLLVMMVLFGGVLVLSQGSVMPPFVYATF